MEQCYYASLSKDSSCVIMALHALAVRWVEGVRASAVSVGTDGQVILVTDNGHLVIYGVDGQLIIDHSLPEDVQRPRHAVFSSASGTFILSHSSVSGVTHRYWWFDCLVIV